MKPVTKQHNGKPVTFHASPETGGDWPWVDIVELAAALGSTLTKIQLLDTLHKFQSDGGVKMAKHGDRIVDIVCHPIAQGIAGAIDARDGFSDMGPAFKAYSRLSADVANEHFPMSFDEIKEAVMRYQ